MVINLKKGQRISLKKEAPKLQAVMCGLGWDVAKNSGGLASLLFGKGLFGYDGSLEESKLAAAYSKSST